MEPLIALIATFLFALIVLRIVKKKWLFHLAGRIAMSVMLVVASLGHFLFTEGMILMLPGFIPLKTAVVYFTGVVEIAAAAGLLIPRFQKLTAWLLIIFLILVLPANIYASVRHLNLRTATFDGKGSDYLWFRIPLQVLFIAWVYYFGIKKSAIS